MSKAIELMFGTIEGMLKINRNVIYVMQNLQQVWPMLKANSRRRKQSKKGVYTHLLNI